MIDIKTHHTRHESGGADEINVGGLSGVLADAQVPQVHDNTKHSPEMLAVDGSNKMQGPLDSTHDNYIEQMRRFFGGFDEYRGSPSIFGAYNRMAFLINQGGSVTFTPTPHSGTAANLFDGKGYTNVQWASPSGDIVIDIVLPAAWSYMREFYIQWVDVYFPTAFTIEMHTTSDGLWHTLADVTGWNKDYFGMYTGATFYYTDEIKITMHAYNRTDYCEIAQILWTYYSVPMLPFFLFRGGDSMQGDIDMNSHSLNNLLQIPFVNVASEPAAPSSGGILYVYGGALKYIGSSGTRTTIANA